MELLNKKVSIIVPCRNESKFIDRVLIDIVKQDYLKENMEVWVVDGMSEDNTREIIKKYEKSHQYIKLVDNPAKTVPFALNKGIMLSEGEIIVRMDAHASYHKDYITRLIYWQQKLNADNVGGVLNTMPYTDSIIAKAIAFAMSHVFGVGNAYFRTGTIEAKEVDTVPFGCYKKEVFDKIGVFDEDLSKNQDDELNGRLKKNGGRIFLVPEIKIDYYPVGSFGKLLKMYYQYGYYKPLVNKKLGSHITFRQCVPPAFILALIAPLVLSIFSIKFLWGFIFVIAIYLLANLFVMSNSVFKGGFKLVLVLPIVFGVMHLSYGWGYWKGLFNH